MEQIDIPAGKLIKRKESLKQQLSAKSPAYYVKYALAFGLIPF